MAINYRADDVEVATCNMGDATVVLRIDEPSETVQVEVVRRRGERKREMMVLTFEEADHLRRLIMDQLD